MSRGFLASSSLFILSCLAFDGVALAHPGGHEEDDRPPYSGYDCRQMAGSYETDQKKSVRVTVFEGTVIVTPTKGDALVGECVSPAIDGQTALPRARLSFGSAFGSSLSGEGCCTVRLKGSSLMFDEVKGVIWKKTAAP